MYYVTKFYSITQVAVGNLCNTTTCFVYAVFQKWLGMF